MAATLSAAGHRNDVVALLAGPPAHNAWIRRALRACGVGRALDAPDGAAALAGLAEARPGLLVLHWDLTMVPPVEIMAYLRDPGRAPDPALPVLATLPDPTRAAVDAARAAKVDWILAAPFSPSTLRLRLEAALARLRHEPPGGAGSAAA